MGEKNFFFFFFFCHNDCDLLSLFRLLTTSFVSFQLFAIERLSTCELLHCATSGASNIYISRVLSAKSSGLLNQTFLAQMSLSLCSYDE